MEACGANPGGGGGTLGRRFKWRREGRVASGKVEAVFLYIIASGWSRNGDNRVSSIMIISR